MLLRFALCLVAGVLAISGARGQERKQAGPENQHGPTARVLERLNSTPGLVRLPGGHELSFQLIVVERKGKTFTGKIVYDLGLREQEFAVEGSIDKGMMTFREKPATPANPVHPHCPVLGGGKFETVQHDGAGSSGVAYLRLNATAKDALAAVLRGNEAIKCEFVLGGRAVMRLKSGQ